MNKFFSFILDRLKEKSTYVGLFTVLGTVLGVNLAPELSNSIMGLGIALSSFILVLIKER